LGAVKAKDEANRIDWDSLIKEFEAFEPDEEFKKIDDTVFEEALVKPVPDFVWRFLKRSVAEEDNCHRNASELYAFLLHKRYYERLNLLYFAFDLFCAHTPLPEAIVNQTPFPHEDGIPKYKYRMDPNFKLS
jgi:hypothetical protein